MTPSSSTSKGGPTPGRPVPCPGPQASPLSQELQGVESIYKIHRKRSSKVKNTTHSPKNLQDRRGARPKHIQL